MRSFIAALILATTGGWANAENPVGRWQLDREAFEAQLTAFMESQLGSFENLPDATKAQVQAMMKTIVAEATSGMEGVAEFRDDGTVVFTDPEGNTDTGTWTLNGDVVTLLPANAPPGQERIQGTLTGDVITVEPDMGDAPPDTPEMTMIFNRLD